jgi:hypothetical protein
MFILAMLTSRQGRLHILCRIPSLRISSQQTHAAFLCCKVHVLRSHNRKTAFEMYQNYSSADLKTRSGDVSLQQPQDVTMQVECWLYDSSLELWRVVSQLVLSTLLPR